MMNEIYVKKIISLSSEKIKKNHKLVKSITNINEDTDDPTKCGVIANAIFNYTKKENSNVNFSLSLISTILYIMKDNSCKKKIYQIGISEKYGFLLDNNNYINHCFCIIKLSKTRYCILQGYFNEYLLKECITKTNIYYSKDKLIKILLELLWFIEEGIYNKKTTETWNKLTGVDISLFISKDQLPIEIETVIYMAYAKSKL